METTPRPNMSLASNQNMMSYDDILAKNKTLKAEIQKLLKFMEGTTNRQSSIPNTLIQNRFESLNISESTNTNLEEDMETTEDQTTADFTEILKKKNKRRDEQHEQSSNIKEKPKNLLENWNQKKQ